jgi:hypothetical protein
VESLNSREKAQKAQKKDTTDEPRMDADLHGWVALARGALPSRGRGICADIR